MDHVDAIELTSGYVRVKGDQDLFAMNHRIKRVEIRRNGKHLGSTVMDTNSRALQRLQVDADGGEFKIIVKETVAGTDSRWREVVVSEFRVLGKPGAERRSVTERIVVSVGSLDATPPKAIGDELDFDIPTELRHPYPSIDAFCKEFLPWAKAHAPAEISENSQWNDGSPVTQILCQEVSVPVLTNAVSPWLGARGVRLAWAYRDATRVFAVMADGIRPTPIFFDDHYGNPMGCPPIWSRGPLERLWVENGWIVATIDGPGPSTYFEKDGHSETAYQRGVAMCRMADSQLRCLELNPQYEMSLAAKTLRSMAGHTPNPENVPWERVENIHVNDRGEISRLRVH
jgi:hypothetical protein